ncbi:MAG: HlyC/CorC family transporter [Calditrichaeota bacterium]|nr:HlyC/CorC family transporter [Calditrichota bacterium]MCB9368470.1 HlyC/CorC family transporter [Calditrichota bacterium]
MDLLILVLIALALSAYFSSMEIAYTTFDRIIIGGWKKAGRIGVRFADFMSSVPERYLFTTLVGNNLAMVGYSFVLVLWADQAGLPEFLTMVISPLIVLVFGEVIPKTLGMAFANPMVRFLSAPLYVLFWLFLPVRAILTPLERMIRRSADPATKNVHTYDVLFRREIDSVLSRAKREGTVTEKESEILERYLHSKDVRARDIMTPRPVLIALPANASMQEVIETVTDSRHGVIPVYDENIDNIVGFLYSRDLLFPRDSIREVMRPAAFVPESKILVEMLEQFKQQRIPAAIVVDEHGGTDGIVTLKDIFREMVGPLYEASEDIPSGNIKRLAAGKYLVSALADLSDIAEATGWRPPDGDYATLSGLLSDQLGHIGRPGEEIEINGIVIRVLGATPRRVESCLVKLPPDYDEENRSK